MIGSNDQVWVTSAVSDEDVKKALVWCYSVRRAYTSRLLAVIASSKISLNLRNALNFGFDLVFFLEEDRNTAHLKPKDFAKLYSLLALRYFKTCAYVSPHLLAVKNCDDIFEGKVNELVLLKDDGNADVFLFKPSLDHFKALAAGLQKSFHNGSGIGGFLQKRTKNQFRNIEFLDGKFNRMPHPGRTLLANSLEISLVNLINYPKRSDIKMLENTGTLEKLVYLYWEKIYSEDVVPLVQHASQVDDLLLTMDQHPFTPKYEKEPIAIVGMSCRFPGSNNLEEFWNLMFQGEDGTCNPPPFRWLREQCCRHKADSRTINAGFLKVPVDDFDAKFFAISPKEVLCMDPQHRLLHELVWEGLEDACIDPLSLRGTSGSVFIGSWTNDYKDILGHSGNREFYRGYMGNSIGAATARLSFLLGLTGPSIATESGCSSVMVAVHSACRSLQNGETSLALVGGVNLLLHPFDKDELPMIQSPDGHCKTFSEDANGFARAEGCGVLVLKKLSDAVRNNDNIWGLIKGSAMAQEGMSSSMGTPTVHCESLAMNDALRDAEVQPEQVSYVETHGTGTTVGDPMEVAAIAKAYHSPNRRDPLIIGSVKTNVGHTESCSGITGIIKVVLAMHHETIPPHINFTKLNPSIDLEAVPALIPMERMEWKKTTGKPRIAGVSSFGITGTDAHVIIQESPQHSMENALVLPSVNERPLHILKVSAKTEEALEVLLSRYKDTMELSTELLADIAYSSNVGRANFSHRATIIAKTKNDVASLIDQRKYFKGEVNTDSIGKVCFLFTGQGSQYPGMAKKLYDFSPVFQMHFDYCDKVMNKIYGINLKSVLWPEIEGSQEDISRTMCSQTSIFCVEYALLKLWESWGVKPDYALGHSLGEFAAAVCAGIISVEDAIKLVAERSRLIDELPRGKMLVIQTDHVEVQNKMKQFAVSDNNKMLDYAAVNSNEQTVVAGDSDVVMEFSKFCTDNKLKCIVLAATHAFHSKHMDPMLDKYRSIAETTKTMSTQSCQYISGMKGDDIFAVDVGPDYWVQHTREKVNFLSASKKAVELGCNIFIEIGPQPVLSALTMMNNETSLLCLPSLKKKENEWETIFTSLGKLYIKGIEIDWSGLDQFYNRKKVRLPHYPFMGKKFWDELMHVTGDEIHPLLGSVLPNASSTKLFQSALKLKGNEYIKDHAIGQTVVFPGAGYLEMALAAGLVTIEGTIDNIGKPTRPMKVENLMIKAPLALEESKTCQLQTVVELNTLKDNENDWNDMTVKIFHLQESDMAATWVSHAVATFSPLPTAEEQSIPFDTDKFLETVLNPCHEESMTQLYEKLASIGLKFGTSFQSIEKLWKDEDNKSLLVRVKVPNSEDKQYGNHNQYIIHPVVLDAMIQALMLPRLTNESKPKLWVPIRIGKLLWLSNGSEESSDRYIYVGHNSDSDEASHENASALLLDIKGKVLAVMSDVELIDTTVKALEAVLEQQTSPMPELWEETWRQKLGPCQQRHDMELCKTEMFYDEGFKENMNQKYNILNTESQHCFNQIDLLVYYNFLRCFYECGWVPVLNDVLEEAAALKELSIKPEFHHMFHYMLTVLSEEGVLTQIGLFTWKVTKMPPSLTNIQDQLSSPTFTVDMVKFFNASLLCAKLGENYSQVLNGNQSALPILFPEEGSKNSWPSVGDFYTDYGNLFGVWTVLEIAIGKLLEHHCKYVIPGEAKTLRVLEVGAGTGSFTEHIVKALTDLGLEVEYDYTDISPAFFGAAEKKFESSSKTMKFKRLNIEEDPVSQGFIPYYYDYVVASEVIHATRNINETLTNVRLLLKPAGRFCIVEQTKKNRIITFLFGVLSGYWRFEDLDVRPDHCILSVIKWDECLRVAGFSKPAVISCIDDHHSLICSSKLGSEELLERDKLHIIEKSSKRTNLWIIFVIDDSPISKYLVRQISSVPNRDVVVVRRGNKLQPNNEKFEINPTSEDDFHSVIKSCEAMADMTVEAILYCWSLDKRFNDQELVLQPYFLLTKAVLKMKQSQAPKMIALLDGVMPVEDNDLSYLHSSTILGFTKALRNEYIHLTCRCIDIGGKEDTTGMEQVFYELWNPDKVTQVAFQGATRYISKLQPVRHTLTDLKLPSGTDRYQLILPETKLISDLQFGPLQPFILEEREIEVVVKASALNFRDVLSVIKPSEEFNESNSVGFDFAGIVKRVGKQVSMWQVGDHVFGVNVLRNALPSNIKLDQLDVLRIPKDWSFPDACTLPAVVATSYHCLIEVAKITSEDTVLIHAASGGVGLSAIEICKHVGVKIIATAGSKRKQNYLRSLGIEHVFHSRNTQYGDQILEVTNGHGVTVVLNSLTSDGFKEATLKACAKGARFVEMSKLSIWQPEEVEALRPDVKYTIIDISCMTPSEWRRMLDSMQKLLEDKVVNPIPYVRFDGVHIREALQYMQKARHIGKVICIMPEVKQRNGKHEVHTQIFNEYSTYLITGGLGGIGFVICQWMVKNGARHVILAGRNAPNETMKKAINKLNSECPGSNVLTVTLDVADFDQCRELLEIKIEKMGLPALRGVMHAAGILIDGVVENQTWPNFSSTFDAKVKGTLNLHLLTKNFRLEHFVLFSSMASVFGGPGQTNHSAGNNFEDTVAHYRNSIGLPATSINWGQWGEVGVAKEMELPGVKPFSNLQALTALEFVLKSHRTQTGAMNIESVIILAKFYPHVSSIFDEQVWKMRTTGSGTGAFHMKSDEFWQKYDSSGSSEEKVDLVKYILRLMLKNILRLDQNEIIEENTNFQEMGVDSLMFVELKNSIQSMLGERVTVNASVVKDCNTIKLLSEALVKVIEGEDLGEEKIPLAEEVSQLIQEDCQLPEHIKSAPDQKRIDIRDISTVFITGCTGVLGPYVLREVSNVPQVKQIICLMRPSKILTTDKRLRNVLKERDLLSQVIMSKVRCVNGNVAFPNLGLEPIVWEEMCNSVDAVFHCAANVSHTEHYKKRKSDKNTRAVNVGGVNNILELACTGSKLKHVFCASSILSVTNLDKDANLSESWPETNDYDGLTTVSYPITKFVSEVILKQAVLERGVPGKVFRLPYLMGDSKTGRFILDNNHAMLRYMFILKQGVIPSTPVPFIGLPVDICAWASVQIFFNPNAPNDIYNISNTCPALDQEFISVAEKLGYHVDIVELSEFTERIQQSTDSNSPFSIFREVYNRKEEDILSVCNATPSLKQWILDGGSDQKFTVSRKITSILPEFYERRCSVMESVHKDLLFARNNGWFEKFDF